MSMKVRKLHQPEIKKPPFVSSGIFVCTSPCVSWTGREVAIKFVLLFWGFAGDATEFVSEERILAMPPTRALSGGIIIVGLENSGWDG
jgi:hypothetical protein